MMTSAKLALGSLVLAAATLSTTFVQAADLGGNCCADLEERIAELEATTVRKGNRKVKLELSGHLNEAVLFWDDGLEDNTYVGTNDVQRSRFRFKGEAKIADDWKAGYLLEIGVRGNRLSRTDDGTDEGVGGLDLRYSAWYIDNKHLGRVWIGETSFATDAITELNTANLTHFARFSASKWNMSNRIIINGVRSPDRRWRDLLPADGSSGDNVPGEGDRGSLIRYETPRWKGFQIQTAWGEDDVWDVALRYAGEVGGFKLLGGIGYGHYTDDNFNFGTAADESVRGCASADAVNAASANDPGAGGSSDHDCNTLGLSASAMHIESGLFVTAAYGIKSDELRDEIFANRAPNGITGIDDEDWFWGVMGGLERKFIDLGKTTFYGEFAHFEAGAQIGDTVGDIRTFNSVFPDLGPGSNFSRGSEVEYWGFGVNQQIEKAAMELYIGYRHHEGEITLSDTTNTGVVQRFSIEDIDMIMSGAKISF
ncbi:MAG: porin [Hyphomicrobium sp.]